MLRAAMVFMILAGIFGLPAVMCSGCWSEMGKGMGMDRTYREGQKLVEFLYYLSLFSSIGSIVIGALVTKFKKLVSGTACFIFAISFGLLLIQGNFLGLLSSLLLVIAGVMIFVAPSDQFSVKQTESISSTPIYKNATTNYQFCGQCGAKVSTEDTFCSECGHSLK